MFDTFCWLNIAGILKRKEKRKGKGTVSKILSLFVWSSPIKILLYFKCTLVLKSICCVVSSIESPSFAHICFSFVSLSLILAKHLIATLKHYKGILEVWLQLIFSNLEVRVFPLSEGVRKRRTWWGIKWNGNPLTCVGDQSSPKLNPTLFAGLPYPRYRSLDWDLFCGGPSARLPSTPHTHKMNSHPGIIIYAASHIVPGMYIRLYYY